jgi:hypothetical protein
MTNGGQLKCFNRIFNRWRMDGRKWGEWFLKLLFLVFCGITVFGKVEKEGDINLCLNNYVCCIAMGVIGLCGMRPTMYDALHGQLYGNVPLFKPRLLLLLLLLSTCTFFSSLHTQKLLQPQLRAMNVRSSEIIIGISCASLGTR